MKRLQRAHARRARPPYAPFWQSCAHKEMVQLYPVQPFSHVHVLGCVQLPLFGHLRICTRMSSIRCGGVSEPRASPSLMPLRRSSVSGA
jgi:hypothetical protein